MVKRYNNSRVFKERVSVRYVFGPKERVMYDIINLSQNSTLPVVVIDITSIRREPQRVFNKQDNFYKNTTQYTTPGTIHQFRTPVPVQISLNVSILAGFQIDLEQIASNFIAYFNPYIILSTKVPSELGPGYELEVRTKAQWDGSLTVSTPIQTSYAEKFRRVGDTTFVLDAWIYPEASENVKPIYFIDANFYAINNKIIDTSLYYQLSGETFSLSSYPASVQGVETVSLSGTPTITNIFFSTSGKNLPIDSDITITGNTSRSFLLYGHSFNFIDYVLLSAADTSQYGPLTALPSTYYGEVSGAIISEYSILNSNMLEVQVPYHTTGIGEFAIITYNKAGWSTTQYATNNTLTWDGTI